MAKYPVSLVIIALNEEAKIARCIESASWADEVIVVDSGSSDRTFEIARNLGAQVILEKWRGFQQQKTFACSLARNSWVLSLDADEALSPELSMTLKNLSDGTGIVPDFSFEKNDGIEFSRISFNLGRWIHHGGWYPDWQLRFFNRESASWVAQNVHEHVDAKNVVRLAQPIWHWPFDSLSEQVSTNNRYSSLGAQDLFDRQKNFSMVKLIFKPISKFIETYLIKRGFQDGMAGFIISVGAAYSVFLKFAKLWESQKLTDSQASEKNQPQN